MLASHRRNNSPATVTPLVIISERPMLATPPIPVTGRVALGLLAEGVLDTSLNFPAKDPGYLPGILGGGGVNLSGVAAGDFNCAWYIPTMRLYLYLVCFVSAIFLASFTLRVSIY